MSWNNGYVSDIEYPAGFFYEQSPVHLNLACLMNGYAPTPLDQPFTYCELGCGTGLTANILAASNPQGRFYAFDFMPSHVSNGRELALEAGLDNLTMLENSFDELAAGKVDLPQFDFVTMYGVYGAISEEHRRHIVDFLQRYVKPGGIVYLNYNTMPGWAAVLPLHRLILEIGNASPGTPVQRFEHARQVVSQLNTLQAKYFIENASPAMAHRLESIQEGELGYLVHEYLNQGGQPLYHAQVAAHLNAAGFDYAGSADLLKTSPGLYLTPQQRALIDKAAPEQRQTLVDYLRNTSFRDDIYIRDAQRLSPAQEAEWRERLGLALIMPRSMVNHKIKLVNGEVVDRSDLYDPVIDELAFAPTTLAELMDLPPLKGASPETIYQIAALLVHTDQACAYQVDAPVEGEAARRMNHAIAFASHYNNANQVLASPVLGNGVSTSKPARLVYRVLCEQGDDADPLVVVEQVWQLMKEGTPPDDMPDREALTARVRTILGKLVPLWRQLDMI